MKIKNKKIVYYPTTQMLIIAFCILISNTACENFTDIELPPDMVGTENVFKNEGSSQSAMLGIYASAANHSGIRGLYSYVGFSSDDVVRASFSSFQQPFAENVIDPSNNNIFSMWKAYYNLIYQCNNMIINVSASNELPESLKKQLEGEAKFIRALSYFYLVNLWDGVPLSLGVNYEETRLLPRSSREEVYAQITDDLVDAQNKLSSTLYAAKGDRTRANKYAATALLARVKLYNNEWSEAETLATTVIEAGLYILDDLDKVFLAESGESIFQLSNPGSNRYTNLYLAPAILTNPNYRISNYIADSLIDGDKRKEVWVTPTNNGIYKYKTYSNTRGPEDVEANIMIRLAEMYLIRAEARAQQGNITGENSAQSDLNTIRARAGMPGRTTADKNAMLEFIYTERMIELFAECGHRWFDVKRTGRADAVFGAHKSGWAPEAALYPIPYGDILKNPNLTQNPGY